MKILIQPLQGPHATEAFSCGLAALDDWLRRIAKQHISKGVSRTFVAIDPAAPDSVLGFYSLTVGEADGSALPPEFAKKLPRRIPILLIGRLATSSALRGQGIGGMLLVDAFQRTVRVASEVGIAAILVDAKDEKAVSFYEHFGFKRLPESRNRLALPIGTARKALEP